MRTKYLLPCSCGEKIPVEMSQAGGQVTCGCGQQTTVPSMRELRTLETAEAAEPRSVESARSTWGPRQGLMLAGVLLLVLALIPAGWLYRNMPEKLRVDIPFAVTHQNEQIDQLSIDQAWMFWKHEIVETGLIEYPSAEKQYNEHLRTAYQRWLTFALCFATLGVLLLVGGVLMPQPKGGKA